jgi:signal transduction histidine kinase
LRINGLSLVSRGTRTQIRIATTLLGVVPALAVCFLAVTFFLPAGTFAPVTQITIGGTAFVLALSGYLLLLAYPRSIVKLREYLREIAAGELPEKVTLDQSEDDIRAIENYLNQVLAGLRNKVQLLERQLQVNRAIKALIAAQQQELLEAEQQRIMIQSLGAMCHHIAQPLTVLSANLYFLRQQVPAQAAQARLAECEKNLADVSAILVKMRQVRTYRTVPYRTYAAEAPLGPDCAILDIETKLAQTSSAEGS